MTAFLDNLKTLGTTRLALLAATGAGLIAALLFAVNLVMAPSYAPLYTDLSPGGASQVVNTLEQAGFKVEVTGGGAVVAVPAPDLARARMALAERGLPDEGVPGWELFDQSSGLGMNSYMQRVNRLRALEGELVRSIQTIDGIDAARVHLVLPEREAFSRERPEPSASVIVRGAGSSEISRRQAMAIRALVAAAVPDLAPGRVTVLSARGQTILGDDTDSAEVTLQSVRAGIEERMSRAITGLLSARVGAGNARVEVNVDLTTERQVVRQQSFDPSQQVVRSTETREESVEDTETASGNVDVAGNLPDALNDGAGPQNRNTREKTNEIVNYEIGTTNIETVREPGDIERVSVAVLVNGIYNVGPDGEVAYEERSAEELARLEALVRSAIGYDEARGDTISVDSLRFMDYSMDVGEPLGKGFGQVLAENLMSILRGLLGLAVVAVALIFGVRPMLARLLPEGGMNELALAGGDAAALSAPEGKAAALPAAQGDPAAVAALTGGTAAPVPQPAGQAGQGQQAAQPGLTGTVLGPGGEDEDRLVNLVSVNGGLRQGKLSELSELADSNPEAALAVIQTWLAEES